MLGRKAMTPTASVKGSRNATTPRPLAPLPHCEHQVENRFFVGLHHGHGTSTMSLGWRKKFWLSPPGLDRLL